MNNLFIYSLAFCSGFCIMTIELLGGRILSPDFGGSVYVWGSIITVFMLSLSLGYLAGGRWSLHTPSLRRFGFLFIGGALALLPLLLFSTPLMESVAERIDDPRYGSLLASLLLFFVPTTLLGMISPYSVRLLVRDEHHSGDVAGRLYFASTLGSALGTLATSFYLVLWFEINTVILSAMAVLFVLGMLAVAQRPTPSTTAAGQS